ncbi:MAG: hypothetical protein ACKVPX_05235 [Myxococcaceae bacterium]
MKWLAKLTPLQRQFLPEVLRGESTNIDLTNSDHVRAQASLLRKTRLALVTGALGRRPIPELIQALTRLAQERPMGRLMRWGVLHALLEVAGGDVDVLKDLILEMYPGEFSEDEVSRGLAGFTEVTAHIGNTRRGSASASAEDAVSALHGVIVSIGQERVDRRRLVMRRLYRDTFYRVMRRDEEIGSRRGLEALARAAEETHRSPSERGLLQETFEFYREARRFQPNGFREDTPHGREPLSPAQRYGIWAAVKSLQNPAETCALLTSEARIGKTIMAVLGAFNVRRADGVSAVQRVLYTTSNQAKYEVCDEIVRRTAFNIEVLVLDGTQEQKRETLRRAMSAPGNVVLLANYESVRDFTDEIQDFRPDAHIIDEINNLRRGDDTLRAPRIFGIRAPYRIGISAQLMVTRSEDVATTLSWARNRLYPTPASAERLRAEELYTALDPISVRWRRRIVLPELVHPQHEARFVEYDEAQDNVIRTMRQDFVRWRRFEARPDKASPADNLFVRFDMERRASVDLALVMPGDHWTHPSHKVRELDGIIDEEAATNGKVLVLVDFPELMDRLITRYNQRLGERAAFGISGKTPMSQRRDIVRKFRGDPQQAKVLFGTSFLLGASLNLSQLPGAPFRNATVVRLSRPWVNLDDGERLIDMKQAHPVRVITLISQFRARQGEPHLSTIEELQEKNLSGKRVLFKSVLDGNPVMSDEQVEALEAMADRASEGLKVTNQAR